MKFYDRHEAGSKLAEHLAKYKSQRDTIVLGLARGGVVVASEVAQRLSLPLNVIVPRKIGAPGNSEFAIGSIMEDGEGIFNESIIAALGVSPTYISQEVEKEKAKAQQRLALYQPHTHPLSLKDKTVILVDDGIATGATMLTAIQAMRKREARRVVVAAPVAATETLKLIRQAADEVVCLYDRYDFMAVGLYYQVFGQTEDSEVVGLLQQASQRSNEHPNG